LSIDIRRIGRIPVNEIRFQHILAFRVSLTGNAYGIGLRRGDERRGHIRIDSELFLLRFLHLCQTVRQLTGKPENSAGAHAGILPRMTLGTLIDSRVRNFMHLTILLRQQNVLIFFYKNNVKQQKIL